MILLCKDDKEEHTKNNHLAYIGGERINGNKD